ncbi:gluconolactonase [Mycolicibacterium thermoresistibile]|uniref:Gluconolactonase n=1 Tax=Mycolicibacterium thermoresistibile TaxID=1797 RepID=A0A100XDD0_MYCTH|nr:gluconolactonase [Mycolicibacterium thermoresistibile]
MPTRHRHGCELCTDGARTANANAARRVSWSGKALGMAALRIHMRSVTTVPRGSPVNQGPKDLLCS